MSERTVIRSRETVWNLWWWVKACFVIPIFTWAARTVTVTDKRVVFEHGILSKSQRSVQLDKVLDVMVTQGPVGRLMGHGTLGLETAGTSGTEFVFPKLQGIGKVREAIYQQRG